MEPITREEKLISGVPLEPITRKEYFLAKAAGMDVNTPEPITREEMFLSKITGGGGGSGGGGSAASVPWNDVTFIDYDGTVLYSYTLEEAQKLTELPPLPTQTGLICQEWNWSLEDIKAQNGPVIVGATYITDDGKTRIYITLHEGRTSPMLGLGVDGTVTVDWGDGTEPDVLTGTSTSTVKWTPRHNYAEPGDYVISLSVEGTARLTGNDTSEHYSHILRYTSTADARNRVYNSAVKKIELGGDTVSIDNYAFNYCINLSSITVPNHISFGNIGTFAKCYSLKHITVPSGQTNIAIDVFNSCYNLASVSLPSSVKSIGNQAFQYCYNLASVTIPNITRIGNNAFSYCYALKSIAIPYGVTSTGKNAFDRCYTLESVTIPNSVTEIADTTFQYCYSITSIVIPNSVTTISQYAFRYCYSLSSVTIPNSVTTIGNEAFCNCPSVKCYDFSDFTSVPSLGGTYAFYKISADCQILVPSALYDEWSTATNWVSFASYMVAV